METQDTAHRSMRDFPLGAMARAGFTHMSVTPTLPDFFTVREEASDVCSTPAVPCSGAFKILCGLLI